MPNDALASVRQLEIGVRSQEGGELRLHRLLRSAASRQSAKFR